MTDIKTYLICESIDTENLFWKVDKWFNDNIDERDKFNELLINTRNNNNIINQDNVSAYIQVNDIKPFVDFITDNTLGTEVFDYVYIFKKIIQLILANKSYKLIK